MLQALWADDSGAILSAEYLFLMTICVCGVAGGMGLVRDAVNAQFAEVAAAIRQLRPVYTIQPVQAPLGGSGGSTVQPANIASFIP